MDPFLNGIFDSLATLGINAVRGIFDEEFENILEAEGRNITFTVDRPTAQNVRHGLRMELGDRQFEVVGTRPIDDGLYVDLVLRELDPLTKNIFVNAQLIDDFQKLILVNSDVEAIEDSPGSQYLTITQMLVTINGELIVLGGVF